MSFTLPRPPEKYDPQDQAQVRIHLERINRQLFENSNTLIRSIADGTLPMTIGPGAIDAASQFAATIQPVRVLAALPGTAADGTIVFLTTDGQLYRRLSGAWTLAVPATNVTGQIVAAQIATGTITANELASNSIIAGKIAAGAINAAALIVNGTITAAKLVISSLSAIAADLGTITAGVLQSANGHSKIDLNATGTAPFIHHEEAGGATRFDLLGNGDVKVHGTLTVVIPGGVGGTDGYIVFDDGTASQLRVGATPGGYGVQMTGTYQLVVALGVGGLVTTLGGNTVFKVSDIDSGVGADTLTSLSVGVNRAGVVTGLNQVSIGAANSGGAGFRVLRVPN